eukprot:COSAG01_NODE_6630_length_3570_cov_14.233938_1_plen_901_part_10
MSDPGATPTHARNTERHADNTGARADNALKLKWQDDNSESGWINFINLDGEPLCLPLQSEFEGELLDVSQQQLDPGYAMVLAWWLTTPFSAVLEVVNLAFNKIGAEGGAVLVEALKTSNIKFLGIGKQFSTGDGSVITRSLVRTGVTLTLAGRVGEVTKLYPNPERIAMTWQDDGSKTDVWINSLDGEPLNLPLQSKFEGTSLDVSHQQFDPGYAMILAWWLATPFSAAAVLTDVNVSGNPLTGKVYNGSPIDGKDISGVSVLFPVMTRVVKLNVSECGLGPTSMPELAKLVSDATAVVKKVVLSKNFLFGSKLKYDGDTIHTVDADQTGWSALCDTLPSSPLEELIAVDIGMGVTGVISLAKAISAGAVITSINCLANNFGDEGLATLLEAVKSSSVRSLCGLVEGQKTADFSKMNLGPIDCKIMAAEFEFRGFIAVLNSLILDHNGIFGEVWPNMDHKGGCDADSFSSQCDAILQAVKTSNVMHLSLRHTGMGPVTCQKLATSLAGLTRVNVLSNPISADGADALLQAFEQNTNLRTLLGIEEGVTELNLSKKNVDPGQAKILAAELKFSRATAALTSLTIDSTGNMDKQVVYTLTADEDTMDWSQNNFGAADATLLIGWLQRPEVNATLGDEQWDMVATLLDESPGILTRRLVDAPVREHANLAQMLPCAAVPVVERVLATTPSVAQLLDMTNAKIAKILANSELRGMESYSMPLSDPSRIILARLARERQLPTLVWSGLQLGDGGAQQLVKELAAGDEPSAVTSLDLRHNELTMLPLELLQLPALTELHFDDPGMQCGIQIDSATSMTVRGSYAITSAGTIMTLARLARERQLPTLVWAGLQLGNGGAQQLVKELAAGDEPSAVTSLDLQHNDLTTLPLELLQLPALTELHFAENPG